MATIANNRFPVGNPRNFRDLTKGKYDCYVYQGDKGDEQFMESCDVLADAWLPTGSIAHIDEHGRAVAGVGTDTAGKLAVPYIVKVGSDHRTVKSEKYNAAGGLVTLLPLTGYFRIITTVFDQGASLSYATGDLLTVKQFQYDGQTVWGLSKDGAALGSSLVVGIVDGPVGNEVKQNAALAFTAFYRPVVK
jgi:hypothetical protein